jgi:hypothetical protein
MLFILHLVFSTDAISMMKNIRQEVGRISSVSEANIKYFNRFSAILLMYVSKLCIILKINDKYIIKYC